MERRNFKELVKIVSVVFILLILLGGALMLRQSLRIKREASQSAQPTPPAGGVSLSPTDLVPTTSSSYPATGKYMLVPASNNVKAGQTFELNAVFSAPGKILDGSDVILRFDPSFLETLDVVEGDYFSTYPSKKIDNVAGTVKISGFKPKDAAPLSAAVFYSKISFRAIKAGTTQVTFDFIKGKTNRTTLVEKGTSQNILGSVFPANITIE